MNLHANDSGKQLKTVALHIGTDHKVKLTKKDGSKLQSVKKCSSS